jgi:hypothetical protein
MNKTTIWNTFVFVLFQKVLEQLCQERHTFGVKSELFDGLKKGTTV